LPSNIKTLIIPIETLSSSAFAVSKTMNLDALSLALAQITFTIKTLTKNNLKNSLAEISNVKQNEILFQSYFYFLLF
jgi:hypothetical protein